MSSERLGIIAKVDVVEADEGFVTPVDFKKGKRPHVHTSRNGFGCVPKP